MIEQAIAGRRRLLDLEHAAGQDGCRAQGHRRSGGRGARWRRGRNDYEVEVPEEAPAEVLPRPRRLHREAAPPAAARKT